MNFSEALIHAKAGQKIRRASWHPSAFAVGMSAMSLPPFNTQGTDRKVNDRTARHIGPDRPLHSCAYFASFDELGFWRPGWLPSSDDLYAEDWELAPEFAV